jgi:hypothetical protein
MKRPASGAAHRAAPLLFGAVGKCARYCPDSVLFMADHLLLTQLPTVAIVPRRVEAMVDAMEKVMASDAGRPRLGFNRAARVSSNV